MIKFLPSYVGSKSYWLNNAHLKKVCQNQNIVELFCGSSIISANFAKTALLNDLDPYVFKIFSNYNDLIVKNNFSSEDYFKFRKLEDWWKYIYCLQKMSFSGVFRYSKNGYNVPIKSNFKDKKINIEKEWIKSLDRFNKLNPIVTNLSYEKVNIPNIKDAVIILDPPYEGSQANYNILTFDYHFYWNYVFYLMKHCKALIIFDRLNNLPFKKCYTRKMRVNGKCKGDVEAMFIYEKEKSSFEKDLVFGKEAENKFYEIFKSAIGLVKEDGINRDFSNLNGDGIELKTDRYDMNKTSNFFIEKFSYENKIGGPWQSYKKGNKYFYYWFYCNDTVFVFNLEKLISKLDKIEKNYDLIEIPNLSHITKGYKIPRIDLEDVYIKYDNIKEFSSYEENIKEMFF